MNTAPKYSANASSPWYLSSVWAVPVTARTQGWEHRPSCTLSPSPNDKEQPRNNRIQIKARRVFLQARCQFLSLECCCAVVILIWPPSLPCLSPASSHSPAQSRRTTKFLPCVLSWKKRGKNKHPSLFQERKGEVLSMVLCSCGLPNTRLAFSILPECQRWPSGTSNHTPLSWKEMYFLIRSGMEKYSCAI